MFGASTLPAQRSQRIIDEFFCIEFSLTTSLSSGKTVFSVEFHTDVEHEEKAYTKAIKE